MKKVIPFVLQISVCIFTLVLLMWISQWKSTSISNVTFLSTTSSTTEEKRAITLPFSQNFVGRYTIGLNIDNVTSDAQKFRIIPDDEVVAIRVNGEAISIDHISHSDRRNYGTGFVVNIEKLKTEQTNTLEIDVINESNPTGFRMEATQRLSTNQFIWSFITLGLFSLFLMRSLKTSKLQKICFLLSLVISLIYLSLTDSRTRTFDVYEGGGHKDYIEHLINEKSLPNPGEGWEYHQPPLYYLIAAATKVIAFIPDTANDLWGQFLALYLWCIFLSSALASLKIAFGKHTLPLLIASFALCLWPAGIIHSIRIGNDLALYAFYGLSFFYTLKWWKTRASIHLFWASLWMGASLLTKSNGLAMTATLGTLFLLHMILIIKDSSHFQQKKRKLARDFAILTSTVFIALALNFGDNIYYYAKGTSNDWLLSNVSQSINPKLEVKNNPENYLIFDSATYLQQPFISSWDDVTGRQYFWNFVWRSSLSSEFSFQGEALRFWGLINGILLLFTLMGGCIYFLQKQPYTTRAHFLLASYKILPWILTLIFPFILLLAYRIKVPLSCNTDFRYIYPVLVSIIFFACLVWKEPKKFPIPAVLVFSAVLIGANSIFWIKNL
jgi:hypothetical protein